MTTVGDYYDSLVPRQIRVGVNARHYAIRRWLREFGLAPGMDVLEIGCGIGTQTALIARELRGQGHVVAVDLSQRSIEVARQRLAGEPTVTLLAADALELDLVDQFDVVVLPDVIEHIPVERHAELFLRIRRWLKPDGWALVHIPSPWFQNWCRRRRPDLLQVVDQAIHTEELAVSLASSGLYIHHLSTYAIWAKECDYQVMLLKIAPTTMEFHFMKPRWPFLSRLIAAVRRRLSLRSTQPLSFIATPASAGDPGRRGRRDHAARA
jgi:trans-aconitate 2-methyltransferase